MESELVKIVRWYASSCQLAEKIIQNLNAEQLLKPRLLPSSIQIFGRPCRQVAFAVLILPRRLLTNFLCTHSGQGAPSLFDTKQWFLICSKIRHPSGCMTFYSDCFLLNWKVISWILSTTLVATLPAMPYLSWWFRESYQPRFAYQGRGLLFWCSAGNEFRNWIVLLCLISAWFTVADRTKTTAAIFKIFCTS